MGMLDKAKKSDEKEPKKKKHPSAGVKEPAKDKAEPEASEAANQEPDADADDSEADGQAQGPGAVDAPQQPQEGGGQDDQQQPQDGDGQAVGGQQGGAPVPDPNAPGAGDTTSGGADTPEPGEDDGDEDDAQMGPAGTGSENSVPQAPISKGMQEEYQRIDQHVQQQLYGPGPLAQHIVETLQNAGKAKISTVVMMTMTVTKGIYKQTQFPIQLAAHIIHDIAGRIMELGQEVKQIQYSDHDASLIISACMEGGMHLFGVTKKQVQNLHLTVGRSTLQQHSDHYQNVVNTAKQSLQAQEQGASQMPGAPGGDAGAQGAPPPAQPGAGPDQSAGEPGEDQEAPEAGGQEEAE